MASGSQSYRRSPQPHFRASSVRGGRQTPPSMDEDLHDVSRITNLARGFKKMSIPEKVGLGRGSRGRNKFTEDGSDIQSIGSMNTCTGGYETPPTNKYDGKVGLGRGYSGPRRPVLRQAVKVKEKKILHINTSSIVLIFAFPGNREYQVRNRFRLQHGGYVRL